MSLFVWSAVIKWVGSFKRRYTRTEDMDALNDCKDECQKELTSMLSCFFGLVTGSFSQGTAVGF